MDDPDVRLLVLIVLAAGMAGALWYFRDDILPLADEPIITQSEDVVDEAPTQSGPLRPTARAL